MENVRPLVYEKSCKQLMFCVVRTGHRFFQISCVDWGRVLQEFFCLVHLRVFVFFLDLYPRSNLIAKEPEPESETVAAEPEPGEATADDSSSA